MFLLAPYFFTQMLIIVFLSSESRQTKRGVGKLERFICNIIKRQLVVLSNLHLSFCVACKTYHLLLNQEIIPFFLIIIKLNLKLHKNLLLSLQVKKSFLILSTYYLIIELRILLSLFINVHNNSTSSLLPNTLFLHLYHL